MQSSLRGRRLRFKALLIAVAALLCTFPAMAGSVVINGASGNCSTAWDGWAGNAAYWLGRIGQPAKIYNAPTDKQAGAALVGTDVAYVIAHGYYGGIYPGCAMRFLPAMGI